MKDLSDSTKKKVENMVMDDVVAKILPSAIILLLIQIYYVTSDILTNYYARDGAYFNKIAEATLIFTSLFALIYIIARKKTEPITKGRIVINIYYFLIATGMSFYFHSDVYQGILGFSASYFYIIIFLVSPLIYFWDNLLIYLYVLGTTLYTYFTIASDSLNDLSQYILVLVVFFFASHFFKTNSVKLNISKYRIEELNERLAIKSYNDQLTTALNRYALEKYVDDNRGEWILHNTQVGLLMIDIDNFKLYNDNYSHPAGDDCLKRIALAIKQMCYEKMPHLFRYGGEEFLMFTVDLDEKSLLKEALKVKEVVEKLQIRSVDSPNLGYVTISIGCAILDVSSGKTAVDYIPIVDEQLYNAKNNGRNCVSYKNEIFHK